MSQIPEELNNTKHHKNILGIKDSKKQNQNIWHISGKKKKKPTTTTTFGILL